MLAIGQCLIIAGVAGLGYEALLWGYTGHWLPTTVDDVYGSLGVYELVANSDALRAAGSWYLETPVAALALLYGVGLSVLGWWRRRRTASGSAVHPSI